MHGAEWEINWEGRGRQRRPPCQALCRTSPPQSQVVHLVLDSLSSRAGLSRLCLLAGQESHFPSGSRTYRTLPRVFRSQWGRVINLGPTIGAPGHGVTTVLLLRAGNPARTTAGLRGVGGVLPGNREGGVGTARPLRWEVGGEAGAGLLHDFKRGNLPDSCCSECLPHLLQEFSWERARLLTSFSELSH